MVEKYNSLNSINGRTVSKGEDIISADRFDGKRIVVPDDGYGELPGNSGKKMTKNELVEAKEMAGVWSDEERYLREFLTKVEDKKIAEIAMQRLINYLTDKKRKLILEKERIMDFLKKTPEEQRAEMQSEDYKGKIKIDVALYHFLENGGKEIIEIESRVEDIDREIPDLEKKLNELKSKSDDENDVGKLRMINLTDL